MERGVRNAVADWPSSNGDVANSRHAAGEMTISVESVGSLSPQVVVATGGSNWSTPIVVGDSLYLTDASGALTRLDRDTGRVVWSRKLSDYHGIDKAVARTSVVVDGDLVVVGDRTGHVIGVERETGGRRWMTRLDEHPGAMVTGSPILHGTTLFVGVSSLEGMKVMQDRRFRSTFIGSMIALDITDGRIVWKTPTMPGSGGWAGGAVISVPAFDAATGTVYFTTDHHYHLPDDVLAKLDARRHDWDRSCFPDDFLASSVIALDSETGARKWSFFGSGIDVWERVCGEYPHASFPFPVHPVGQPAGPERLVPPPSDYLNWSFAAGSPQIFDARIDGRQRHLVGVAEKSGVYWAFDAATGEVVWHTVVGPWSEPGGLTWGAAWDGQRLYVALTNLERAAHALKGGALTTGGSWAALDPATGAILWQVAEPNGAPVYAAPVVANGVIFGASMASSGDQMFALDAATGEILWRFASGGSVAAHPAVADGRVYWGSGFTLFGGAANDKTYVFGLPDKPRVA